MEEIITLIANQGFAIAIATYTIVVVNRSVQENTKALTILAEKIDNEGK